MTHTTLEPRLWFPMVRVVLRRPDLWWIAMRQFRRMIAPGWWRRRPFLPVPDAAYIRYRMDTAYGCARAPESEDVITYLEWCRETERLRKMGARRTDESPVHFDHRR